MKIAWHDFLSIVPPAYRTEVDRLGKEHLQELRLRLGRKPELRFRKNSLFLQENVKNDNLEYVINVASQYSPWAARTVSSGFLTAPGGHRIGIGGEKSAAGGYRNVTSLCIRVARDFPGIGKEFAEIPGNILILGLPGSGKTTLLRDYIRSASDAGTHICAIDSRCELFPEHNGSFCFPVGARTDVLTGCEKRWGIDCALKVMNPERIALDEITSSEDCNALLEAFGCGVPITATAHGQDVSDLKRRRIYRELWDNRVFDYLIQMLPGNTRKGEWIAYDA